MRNSIGSLALLASMALTTGALAQSCSVKNNLGSSTDTGASGGTAAETSSTAGDPNSMKGKVYDPNLLKNGTGGGQSPAVPTGTATRPGTNNTAPTP